MTASFRLSANTFCVGEPIVVEFTAVNHGEKPFSFDEGGDYRGSLRHHRYSFVVRDAEGRKYSPPAEEEFGGMGRRVTLLPGRRFRSWQLLNAWFYLLPPGRYKVHCKRTLALDDLDGEAGAAPVFEQTLPFTVRGYSKQAIQGRIASMQEIDVEAGDPVRVFSVPIDAAIQYLRLRFLVRVPENARRSAVRAIVLRELPVRWDDRYYVEYDMTANRNWLTPNRPETLRLTFVARNHGKSMLPHRFDRSALSINGTALANWGAIVRRELKARGLPDELGAGRTVSWTTTLDDVLPPADKMRIDWSLGKAKKQVCVRRGR